MSIVEKLTTIAENTPKVYDSGYSKGTAEGYSQAESDFWDAYQQNGTRRSYLYAFAGTGWTDETFKPKYDIKPTTLNGGFNLCEITDLVAALERQGVVLDTSNATNMNSAFSTMYKTTRLPAIDASKCTNTMNMFYASTGIKWIEKFILSETTTITNTGNTFAGANALEHIIFEGVIWQSFKISWCPLDHESIMSILNCLKDYAGSGTTYTVTLGTENLNKLTDAEKAIATQKGWSLA